MALSHKSGGSRRRDSKTERGHLRAGGDAARNTAGATYSTGNIQIGTRIEVEKDGLYYLCHVLDLDALNGRLSASTRVIWSALPARVGNPSVSLSLRQRVPPSFPLFLSLPLSLSPSLLFHRHQIRSLSVRDAQRMCGRLLVEYPWAGRLGLATILREAHVPQEKCSPDGLGTSAFCSIDAGVGIVGDVAEGWEWVGMKEERLYIGERSVEGSLPGAGSGGAVLGTFAGSACAQGDRLDCMDLPAVEARRVWSSLQVRLLLRASQLGHCAPPVPTPRALGCAFDLESLVPPLRVCARLWF